MIKYKDNEVISIENSALKKYISKENESIIKIMEKLKMEIVLLNIQKKYFVNTLKAITKF